MGIDAGAGLDERRSEMLSSLERGDLRPLDAGADEGGPCDHPLWKAMRALLEGRTHECQRHNREATSASSVVQTLHLRVTQGRLAEMEVPLRALAAEPAASRVARASLAWLLGLLGRDREAGAELSGLAPAGGWSEQDQATVPGHTGRARDERDRLAALVTLAEVAAMLHRRSEAADLFDLMLPHRFRIAVDGDGAVCHGSVSRHLGLLAHVLGRWDEADAHFENALVANRGIGAPLLVAHTGRDWSALLRARGDGHDWDRAIALLTEAEAVYRRLGVDGPAAEAQAVLARATAHDDVASATNVFRPEGDEWVLGRGGRLARVAAATGMGYLGRLLAHPGQAFHVADLSGAGVATGLGRADEPPPWGAAGGDGVRRGSAALDERARQEYRERLHELDRRLARAVDAGDRMEAALVRAESDRLVAELDAATEGGAPEGDPLGDPLEQARLAVATAIRLSLDRIDAVHPGLARHLRLTVRTGMFCSYVPPTPTTWHT